VTYPDAVRAQYRAAGLWTGRSLPVELVAAAQAHSSRPALVTPETTLSYHELYRQATCLAAGLPQLTRLRAGDAVMFQMGNVAEAVVACLGCLLAGLRPVCTLPQHGEREIGLLAQHVGARGLFVQADFGRGDLCDNARSLLDRALISDVVVFRGDGFDGSVAADDAMAQGEGSTLETLPFASLDPWQIAVFQLSGGTTGLPKVAPRLHEEYTYNARAWAHTYNARAWAQTLEWDADTVVLYPLPIMHNAGIALALQPALLSGATLVLAPSASTETILDLVEEHRPDAIPLVPPAVAIRLLESPRSRRVDWSCVLDFVIGGQKLAPEIATRLHRELGIHVRQKFGMAEGMFLVTPREATEKVRYNTVGAPISPADEVRILVPGTSDPVTPGQVGEFCARGPYTIRGYYRAEEHNKLSFTSDGFYRSGDLAKEHVVNRQKIYSIEGRIKDVINRGAEKIHAEEIEELILRHPDVANVAVVAMPDRLLGEKACAYLVLEPGALPFDVESLGAFLSGQGVAKYKLPERVEIVSQFPLTNVGKVSKRDLRHDVERRMAAENSKSTST
jgi:2,3-dihydroxybenzoate-AMP ligase